MRVVVTGATGNVGTSLLEALAGDPAMDEIVGIARRRPGITMPKTKWTEADVLHDDLVPHFRGADCVVHLAWLIQPSRDVELIEAINVRGSLRVMKAVQAAGVRALVVASSVGAYSAGPKDREVDESWPTEGIGSCYYARQKVAVERLLDQFERDHPAIRVVRMRPAIILKGEASAGIRRLFFGPFLPNALVRKGLVPVVPDTRRLRLQLLHSKDAADAYRRAIVGDVAGPFNLAADPVVDTELLAEVFDARPIPVRAGIIRAVASLSWQLRLQPTDPAWLDMGLGTPLLDSGRARRELGWTPRRSAEDILNEFIAALRGGESFETPPLEHGAGGPFRLGELTSGVGSRP